MEVEGQVAEATPETPTEPVQAPQSWFDSFEDGDLKGFVEAKGLKSAEQAVKSYREAEKFLGAPKDKLLRWPDELNEETLAPIYDKLGRPESPEGYEFLKTKEGQVTEFGKNFGELSHKTGLSVDQSKAIFEWAQSQEQAMQEAEAQALEVSKSELKQEWGQNYDKNLSLARHGAKEFGVSEEDINSLEQVLGHKKTMELFARAGERFGEHEFKGNPLNSNQQYTPQGAQAQLESLMNDTEFMKRIQAGDTKAIEKHSQLVKMVALG